jgi:glycerate kinase
MKIIIAPDKFKGSLTAFEVCRAISNGIREFDKHIDIISFPMADGGDGFASVMQYYLQTTTIDCKTVDPLDREIDACYQWNPTTKTAIIEMAVASGLVLLKEEERNPMLTSSYGTGLLIKDALNRGAVKIILGLGGSATNDGGIGILSAIGFQLKDGNNNLLKANGENLAAIRTIIPPPLVPVNFEIACDVKNVLYGTNGASFIYGPQKGADEHQVRLLDDGLKNLAAVLFRQTGRDIADKEGVGAAGGIAASLLGFFDTQLKEGIDMILSVSGLEEELHDTNLVITGEGKIDLQSMEGKVIGRIAGLANERKIPAIAFCGRLDMEKDDIVKTGLANVFVIGESLTLQESMNNAGRLLEVRAREVVGGWW